METTVESIVAGETFFVEVELNYSDGSSVDTTDATPSVVAQDPLDSADFTVTNDDPENGVFTIRVEDTSDWPAGVYDVELWLDWGASYDVRYEAIVRFKVAVSEAIVEAA